MWTHNWWKLYCYISTKSIILFTYSFWVIVSPSKTQYIDVTTKEYLWVLYVSSMGTILPSISYIKNCHIISQFYFIWKLWIYKFYNHHNTRRIHRKEGAYFSDGSGVLLHPLLHIGRRFHFTLTNQNPLWHTFIQHLLVIITTK